MKETNCCKYCGLLTTLLLALLFNDNVVYEPVYDGGWRRYVASLTIIAIHTVAPRRVTILILCTLFGLTPTQLPRSQLQEYNI